MSRSSAAAITLANGARVYEVDGKSLPSVTTILRSGGLAPDYRAIDPGILATAAQRGVDVHAACEAVDKGLRVEPATEAAYGKYVDAYRQFLADSGATLVACETLVHHPEMGYAGTFDWVGNLNGRRCLVDRKVTAEIHHTYVAPQCAAYAEAWSDSVEEGVRGIYSLHLRRDGTYRLREYDYAGAWEAFRCALQIYRYKTTAERARKPREES